MALFVGGPADGWRIQVEPDQPEIQVALNPNPPAFTPDLAVLNPEVLPTFIYKRECIKVASEEYCIYIPRDWTCDDLVQALILYYRKDNKAARLNYINTAEGVLYDNDDRILKGRPYQA